MKERKFLGEMLEESETARCEALSASTHAQERADRGDEISHFLASLQERGSAGDVAILEGLTAKLSDWQARLANSKASEAIQRRQASIFFLLVMRFFALSLLLELLSLSVIKHRPCCVSNCFTCGR